MPFPCLPTAYRCDQEGYLVVKYLDGHVEHLDGPRQMWFKSFTHESIHVEQHRRHVATDKQCIDIVHRSGRFERRFGPCTVTFDPFSHSTVKVETLRRYVASQGEYLVVQYKDGRMEHLRGPQEVAFHPLEHESIAVHEALRLAANEAVVVYRRQPWAAEEGSPSLVAKLEVVPAAAGPVSTNPAPVREIANAHARVNGHTKTADKTAEDTVQDGERLPTRARPGRLSPPRSASRADGLATGGRGLATAEGGLPTGGGPAMGAALGTGALGTAGARRQAQIPLLTTETMGQEGAMHVERRVVHGPAVFIPDSNEWLHSFSWHGSLKADGKGSKTGYAGDHKVPHALNFQVIRCMPDSMYLSVRDVRTVDDANLTVHLMLFYELESIETMLDSTNDMIGDFVNAASADVMTFASRLTYETFLQETAELSRVANFPILTSRMEQTGVSLLKVVYRGYGASAQLQEMHDQAISRRTKLRLEADAAREEQEKRSMELRCRRDRSTQEQELEAATARHKLEVQSLQKEQERRLADEVHAQSLRYAQETAQVELANERERHEEFARREKESAAVALKQLSAAREEELKKYEGLKEMGVDLTAYLCALATVRPDQHLKIDSNGAHPPAVHLELPKWAAPRH